MPVAATMPNITRPAPAQHDMSAGFDQRAHLRDQAEDDQDDATATQTKRLLTPVTPTRPTFCEKLRCRGRC
jgi:hypothetical protein